MKLSDLRAAFAGRLLTEHADTAPFLTDWRRKWTGRALAVAQPDTAADVAAVVRWCRAQRVAVVPQGGNTGLSGGATPDGSGRAIVLSTARLKKLRALDPVGNTLSAEAGVTLQQLQDAAQEAGRLFPLSLAAQGTCTVGGNLATNAGGVQDISESQGAEGPAIEHDIALPIARIPECIASTDASLAGHFPGLRLVVFGHLGDGNLHYNLSPAVGATDRDAFAALEAPVNRLVHDAVHAHGGSISAEHGLGMLRRAESARYKSAVELQLMHAIKRALDPLNLMNPAKLLAPETNP
jgi:FAD/FMN-containing dehydrogenase